ncbi:hypothetical protein ACNH6C_13780 [Bdellovibrio bacteriovorus]|uniref:hypothetical protein n=1 Tax=Bdellovibrio bacteriovorus TaxID=959 RepID=UPI003A7F956E
MSGLFVVEKLDQFGVQEVLSAFQAYSDCLTFNIPKKGYENDGVKIEEKLSLLEPFYISESTNSIGSHETVDRKFCLNPESIRIIGELGSSWGQWDWGNEMPEDITLYRKDSGLVLFEGYKLDQAYFAVLAEQEIEQVSQSLGVRVVGRDFESFGSLSELDLELPRLAAVIRSYSSAS